MLGIEIGLENTFVDTKLEDTLVAKTIHSELEAKREPYPRLLFVFVVQMVATAMEVDAEDIRSLPRGNTKLCRARQIAMYLMNVVMRCPYKDIGNYFDKDRTTVRYACGIIEELRDIPAFDDRIGELEGILLTVLELTKNPIKGRS